MFELWRQGLQVALTGPSLLILFDELVFVLALPWKATGRDIIQENPIREGVSFDGV